MRLLLLTHHYEPERGAPSQRWGALVRRFRDAGHDVAVVTPPPHYPASADFGDGPETHRGATHEGLYGETIHRVACRPHADSVRARLADQIVSALDSTRTSWSRFRGERPDVVIATAPAIPTLGAGALVARTLRVPLVTEMRDAWPDLVAVADQWDIAAPPAPSRMAALLRPPVIGAAGAAISVLQRRSDAVVTTTESFAGALRSRGLSNVHVVRNGAHGLPDYPVHHPRTPDGELHVLYLGTVGRAQGLGTAIVAARRAHALGARVRLRIVGAGAELAAVAEMAAKGDVPIEMLGHVPKSEVASHYRWADTVLVALRPWPALSLAVPSKLYEAMSIGIHITGAVAGETAEIIRDTGAGLTVPPGDADALAEAWAKLASDPGSLVVDGRAREWTREHANNDLLAEHYLSILHDVVSRHG